MIYIFRLVVKLNIRLLVKMTGWQTMNVVPGYKKLKEMYIVLNAEFAQKLYQFLVTVTKLWSRMQKVSNIDSVCQNLMVQPFHFQVQVKYHNQWKPQL